MKDVPLIQRPSDLPSVEVLVAHFLNANPNTGIPRRLLVEMAREVIANTREKLGASKAGIPSTELERALGKETSNFISGLLAPVVNATGILIHTNLGRAPLAKEVATHLATLMAGYMNLEYSIADGERGVRGDSALRMLRTLCGTEDALVVNNCAAALMLVLNTLAHRKEVIVSRGELVQIGGGFRIPDILASAGARLVEVGTTNVTTLTDYESACTTRTGLLLKMHRSNFAQSGFTAEVSVSELARLGRAHAVPILHDIGSGLFAPLPGLSRNDEPTVQSSISAGADLVCFSTDKLFGALQAGVVAGVRPLVRNIRKNPMYRALRPDKYALAVLQETLRSYLNGTHGEDIPLWKMASVPESELYKRARSILAQIGAAVGISVEATEAQYGGGSTPDAVLPSVALVIASSVRSPQMLASALRRHNPPVIGRADAERYFLDLRAVAPEEDALIVTALKLALSEKGKRDS